VVSRDLHEQRVAAVAEILSDQHCALLAYEQGSAEGIAADVVCDVPLLATLVW